MRVLIVDGANVVGARPDGWWRDRAGAAGRLYESLRSAGLDVDAAVLVLEGAARAGVPEGRAGDADPVLVVHAPGSGDDEIVARARRHAEHGDEVTVVTADRGLRARVAEVGGTCVGPSWLRQRTE